MEKFTVRVLSIVVAFVAFVQMTRADQNALVSPFMTVYYDKQQPGADKVTAVAAPNENRDLVITGQSSVPPLVGEVEMTANECTWKGRPAGYGVFYTIWGRYSKREGVAGNPGGQAQNQQAGAAGGAGGPSGWMAWYDHEREARIVLVPYVGDTASVDVWPKNGKENRLLVQVVGGEKTTIFTVDLFQSKDIATLNPQQDILLTNAESWGKMVVATTPTEGELEIKAYAKVGGAKEGRVKVRIADFKEGNPIDPPTGDMWDMGGDVEKRKIGNADAWFCAYKGKEALKAVSLKDKDYEPATAEFVEDTFKKSDAVLWRCDAPNGLARGSCSPSIGMATVWYAVEGYDARLRTAPNDDATCGIILDVKDDGRYAKDEKPTKTEAFNANPRRTVWADPFRPGYFQVKSMVVHYYQPPEMDKVTLSDDNGGGKIRKSTSFLEVATTPLQATQIKFKLDLKPESEPMPEGFPKYYYQEQGENWVELNDFRGQLEGHFNVSPSGVSVFASPAGIGEYHFKVVDHLNNYKQYIVKSYPTGEVSAEVGKEIIDLVKKFKNVVKKIKDFTGYDLEAEGRVDSTEAKLEFSCEWKERKVGDPRENEVLYACSVEAGFNPLIGINLPTIRFPLDAIAFPTAAIELTIGGSLAVVGTYFRDEDNPNGNGGIRGTASITGALAGVAGNKYIVKVEAGAKTGITGSLFVGGVPTEDGVQGIGLEGKVEWDGILLFVKVTALGGGVGGEKSYQLIESMDICKGHWVWIDFNKNGAK